MKRPGATLEMRHVALYVRDMKACEHFYVSLLGMQVEWRTDPRTHRDGARSFCCYDPDRTTVQIIFHPPIAAWVQQY